MFLTVDHDPIRILLIVPHKGSRFCNQFYKQIYSKQWIPLILIKTLVRTFVFLWQVTKCTFRTNTLRPTPFEFGSFEILLLLRNFFVIKYFPLTAMLNYCTYQVFYIEKNKWQSEIWNINYRQDEDEMKLYLVRF